MKSIGLNVPAYQIVGVHRIGKKRPNRPRNVIVRFINRKNAFTLLKNKKKLNTGQYKRYFIIENLCPYNKRIFNKLYKYKKEDEIHSVWSYNGQVFAKVDENDEPTRIEHFDDIDDLWEESEYEEVDEVNSVNDGVQSERPVHPSGKETVAEESSGVGFAGGFGFGSTPKTSVKKKSKRRLSDINEESGIRTPIEPIRIKV